MSHDVVTSGVDHNPSPKLLHLETNVYTEIISLF